MGFGSRAVVLFYVVATGVVACTSVGNPIIPADPEAGDGALADEVGVAPAGSITSATGIAGDAANSGAAASGNVAGSGGSGVAASGAVGGASFNDRDNASGVAGSEAIGTAGTGGSAMPCVPSAETCDGVDNDCDGMADEGVTHSCWVDEDGDGVAAASAPMLASCDECGPLQTARAPASAETIDCDDADPTKSPQATGVCGDNIDNDCNGTPDDKANNACDGPCTMQLPGKPGEMCSNGLKGACARTGTYECQPDHTLKCSAPTVMGTAEKCGDGSDNDCDGVPDNGCIMNKCGGWTKLSPDKGESCSMGEGSCKATGSYVCDGPDRTVCSVVPKLPNGCGGCTPLPLLGGTCTAKCSPDGTYVCDGKDATKCSVSARPTNGCGGCSTLSHDKGQSCGGECGARGSYTCVSSEQTTCTLASTPKRNLCGGCGPDPSGASVGQRCTAGMNSCATIGSYACTGAGDSAVLKCNAVVQQPTNGCGGCIGPSKGTTCEATDSAGNLVDGVYVCDGELTFCEPRTAP